MAATGQAGGAAAGGDAGQQASNGHQADGGPDLAQLAGKLDALGDGQAELRDWLKGQADVPLAEAAEVPDSESFEEGADGELDEIDLESYLLREEGYGDDPADGGDDLQQLVESVAHSQQVLAQQAAQEAVAPALEHVEDMRRQQELSQLVGEYPELGDQEVFENVLKYAEMAATAWGVPQLVGEPSFLKWVYMAGRAAQIAQDEGEQEGDSQAAHLEGGGGANGGGGGRVDAGDAWIAGARGSDLGHRVLPFH